MITPPPAPDATGTACKGSLEIEADIQTKDKFDGRNTGVCLETVKGQTELPAINNLLETNRTNEGDLQAVSYGATIPIHALSTCNPSAASRSSTPDLPEPTDLLAFITEKATESLLIVYPSIEDSLESLNAVKPAHGFPMYADCLHRCGYRYIDEIADITPETLAEEVKMFLPVAREIHKYAVTVSRQIKMDILQRK
ncbi:hypothetical protein BDV93DRAFT_560637 [Ceratobasidium sp. AG-I]|nr:hypothetical protein BDV93DRAFT_560637 [Ceratobasidium sp. AG-I]